MNNYSSGNPPPVPARPQQEFKAPNYGSPYQSGYPMPNSYGYGSYGTYGGYGNGYGYRGGYGMMPPTNNNQTTPNFVRLAEENTRPAFETIQSVVHSFNSMSMMFESTYFALHTSFRAMLGVVEHMTRAKLAISNSFYGLFRAIAGLRLIRWIYNKLRSLLGYHEILLNTNQSDSVWNQAFHGENPILENNPVNWPILIYTGLTIAAPYLMWKLISSFAIQEDDRELNSNWISGESEHFVAKALYNFQAESAQEISLTVDQEVIVAPKDKQPKIRGWLLGSVDGKQSGLIPANYVKIIGKKIPEKKPDLLNDSSKDDLEEAFKIK